MASAGSDEQILVQINGQEPVPVTGDPEALSREIEAALNAGTVLRLVANRGTLLLNGRAVSSVLLVVEQPAGAEPQNI